MSLLRSLASFVILASSALARDYSKCDGTTYDMSVCLSKIYERSDGELNAVYKAALRQYSGYKRHTENLRMSERRWISYRDAQCKAEYDLFEGGTMAPLINLGCLIKITDQRIAELKDVYLSPR